MKFLQLFPQRRKKTLNQKLLNVTKKTSVQIELISSSPPPPLTRQSTTAHPSARPQPSERRKKKKTSGALLVLSDSGEGRSWEKPPPLSLSRRRLEQAASPLSPPTS